LSQKISQVVNIPAKNAESLQVLHYGKGGKYDPHYDACEEKEKGFCDRMNIGGPRISTVIIYLNDDYSGGGTHFPQIGYTVKPQKGKAVLFHNVDADFKIIPEALHGGQPVLDGEKWIANKWFHAYEYANASAQ
jgi:prolyl 4-hydroxylase